MTTPRDPEELEAAASAVDAEIPPTTTLGAVHLTVSDLARSLDYYREAIGLRVLAQEDGRASLGSDSELLVLVEEPGAPHSHGHTGLYHFALLLPERADLAVEPFDGLPGGTIMGHVHLKVADVTETVRFYRDLLGFGLMAQLGSQAAFLSAGGYHHHIGANTWESAGASPPPSGSASLR